MYTKIFIIIIFFIAFTPSTISVGSTAHRVVPEAANQLTADHAIIISENRNSAPPQDWLWNIQSSYDSHYNGRANNDDDGKSHHIHFSRFVSAQKLRRLYCIIGKFILVITYIGSLISVFLHISHGMF